MVTINEIAKLANVSKSTISRYFNGGSVSPETRKKIQVVVQKTNYQPNAFAQSLKASVSPLVATVVPRLDGHSLNISLESIDEILYKNKNTLCLVNTTQDLNKEVESLEELERMKVGGIILFATAVTDKLKKALSNIEIPVVVVGQKIDGIHCIRNDDYYAARILAEYLLRLGHRKFLYFGVKKYDEAVGVYRQKGLFDILQIEGVEIEYQECEFLADYSKNEAMKILPDTNATCVVCATDNIALGVHRACYELGINIPEDLSICGFGGYRVGEMLSPSLTTVQIAFDQIGTCAAESLIDLMAHKTVPTDQVFEGRLEIRESTKSIIDNTLK